MIDTQIIEIIVFMNALLNFYSIVRDCQKDILLNRFVNETHIIYDRLTTIEKTLLKLLEKY